MVPSLKQIVLYLGQKKEDRNYSIPMIVFAFPFIIINLQCSHISWHTIKAVKMLSYEIFLNSFFVKEKINSHLNTKKHYIENHQCLTLEKFTILVQQQCLTCMLNPIKLLPFSHLRNISYSQSCGWIKLSRKSNVQYNFMEKA